MVDRRVPRLPLGGVAGTAVAGRVDSPLAALLGRGRRAGHRRGPGVGQPPAARPAPVDTGYRDRHGPRFLLGAATVGYRTSPADLALMGALTGLVLGIARALALPRHTHRRRLRAAALPALWALGWPGNDDPRSTWLKISNTCKVITSWEPCGERNEEDPGHGSHSCHTVR